MKTGYRLTLTGAGLLAALVLPARAQAGDAPALVLAGSAERAGSDSDAGGDKSGYHLFNPTPRELMREMATDRPDTTESPISVDAGHFQLETEVVTVARDEGESDNTIGSLNLKFGLATWTDLQIVFELLHQVAGENAIGDLTFRNKINLWGNDGGSTAFALMPFVTLPTSRFSSGYVEGGLIAPLGIEGPAGWEFATMLELDAVRRAQVYGMELVATGTAGHALWKDLGGFIELAGTVPLDANEDMVLAANSGLTLGLSDNLVFDGGVRVGLTDSAQDIAVFLGGSGRY